MMAEQKRVTRRGVRAMMKPRPRRVVGRDPYKPVSFERRDLQLTGFHTQPPLYTRRF